MSINKIHCLIASVAALTLTACGGGGGGDSTPTETITINTAEQQAETRSLTGTVASLSKIRGSQAITLDATASEAGTNVVIQTGQLENDANARFKVVLDTAQGTKNVLFDVSATNTSAQPLISRAEALVSLPAATSILADDIRLTTIALDLEYLAGELTAGEQTAAMADIDHTIAEVSGDLSEDIERVRQTLASYRQGTETETALAQQLAVTDASASEIGFGGEVLLERARPTLSELGIDLPENIDTSYPVVFVKSINQYTRFARSPFGRPGDDGQFHFHPEFEYLNAVFDYATPAPNIDQPE